ncbi:MAG: apolipoprotein N-acyltransferase [Myxococcota bacterium]|nr:apolipoprotein N-acyltransferase [Myxococcota bacterium]
MSAGRHGVAWLAAYAVFTFLSFPHPVAGRVIDLGVFVAWLGPACLWFGLRGVSPVRAARRAFLASLVAHTAILHWIWIVTVVYGHAHPVFGVLGPIGLGAYIAAFTAAFGALAAVFARSGWGSPLLLAATWAALDYLRSFALSGFPWATLGYAQHLNPALLGLAPWTGVYGLSFATALAGFVAARAAADRREAGRFSRQALVGVAVLVAALVFGAAAYRWTPPDPAESVRVAVVQGNVDQGVKWNRDWYERTLRIYEGLTRSAAAGGAEIVVWPETAVPGVIGDDPRQMARIGRLARETGTLLVVGAVGLESGGDGGRRVYDSAFPVGPDGVVLDRYDKSHLVPFGEYVPFGELLDSVFRAVARGIAETGVTPGAGPRPLDLPVPGSDSERLTAGVLICYELLFPDLVRRFVRDGAEMFFAITNDAWYGRTGAPYQFLAITALRSAETRVWTARAANTGVSAIIDARGRVRARTRIFERDWLQADIPLRPAPVGGSFYTRHGDVFAWVCWVAVAGVGLLAWRGRRRT